MTNHIYEHLYLYFKVKFIYLLVIHSYCISCIVSREVITVLRESETQEFERNYDFGKQYISNVNFVSWKSVANTVNSVVTRGVASGSVKVIRNGAYVINATHKCIIE